MVPECLDSVIPVNQGQSFDSCLSRQSRHGVAGFIRNIAAATGRPGYEPRDLLNLHLFWWSLMCDFKPRRFFECTKTS